MDIVPSGGVYAFMFLFGGASVAYHGYALYGTPLDRRVIPHGSSLLEGLPLTTLVGTRAFNRGFLCYLAIAEFLFLVLSFSSVILELTLSVVDVSGSIGALEAGDENGLNPLTPIFASSVIVTGSYAKPLSQIEQAIRRLAHRVAGIPDGIYEMIGRVGEFDFALSGTELERASAAVRKGHARSAAVGERARRAMAEDDAERLARNVRRLYALRAWTVGPDGDGVWDRRSRGELRAPLTLARSEFLLLDERLHALSGPASATSLADAVPVARAGASARGEGTPATPAVTEAGAVAAALVAPAVRRDELRGGLAADDTLAWRELAGDVERLGDDLATLLTLLVTNQSQVRVPEGSGQLRELLAHVQRREQTRESDALVGSVLGGLFLGLLLAALFYAAEESVTGEGGGAFALLSAGLRRAMGALVPLGIVFATAAATALGVRAARVSALQWSPWNRDAERLPVRQYASVALMSTLMGVLFYTLYVFTVLVILPSLVVDGSWLSPSLLRDFADYYPVVAPLPLIGAVCAMCVCLVADAGPDTGGRARRAVVHVRRALLFAAACGVVGLVGRLLAGEIEPRSALEALLVPMLALCPCFFLFSVLFTRRARRRAWR